MVKSELINRSPLRILEKSIQGGVGKGNIGIIASRKGVGKTACLVHIATDKLLRGRHVIHVSFSKRTDHIISWYEDIFNEISRKRNLENAIKVHDEIIKNRVIMNFSQDGIEISQILKSLEAMIVNGNFKADSVIVDGYDFENVTEEGLDKIKDFAKVLNLEIWFSVSLKGEEPVFDNDNFPVELKGIISSLDVVLTLKYDDQNIRMDIVKDHNSEMKEDLHLMLDPKTLLIVEA